MHNDFADWNKVTALTIDRDTLQLRWKGVEAVLAEINSEAILELIKMAYKWPLKPSEYIEKFRQYFKTADVAFQNAGNDKEVQVLAGCVLALLCVDEAYDFPEASLAILTASACGILRQDTGIDLLAMAKHRTLLDGANARKRPEIKDLAIQPMKKQFDSAVVSLTTTADIPTVIETFKTFGSAINSLSNSIQTEFKQRIAELTRTAAIQDEELQTLWWVIGQRSKEWGMKFADIDQSSRSLLLAYEYYKITSETVEPPSMTAILSRVGIDDAMVTIPAAVNSCGADKLAEITKDNFNPITCPVLDAIKRAIETGDDQETWVSVWSKVSGIAATQEVSSLDLAAQFYRELQLCYLISA